MKAGKPEEATSSSWNFVYAKSVQGVCKILFLLFNIIAIALISATPYAIEVFLLDYVTWPFHVIIWICIFCLIFAGGALMFFVAGKHLDKLNVNWHTMEFALNVILLVGAVTNAVLEFTNLWRWDTSYAVDGVGDALDYWQKYGHYHSDAGPYGHAAKRLGVPDICKDSALCTAYHAMLLGEQNPFLGNHIGAGVVFAILIIVQEVAIIYSFREHRRFQLQRAEKLAAKKAAAGENHDDKSGNYKLFNPKDDDDDLVSVTHSVHSHMSHPPPLRDIKRKKNRGKNQQELQLLHSHTTVIYECDECASSCHVPSEIV